MDSFYFKFKDNSFHEGFYLEVISTTAAEATKGADAGYAGQVQAFEAAEDASLWLQGGTHKKLATLHNVDGKWTIKHVGW